MSEVSRRIKRWKQSMYGLPLEERQARNRERKERPDRRRIYEQLLTENRPEFFSDTPSPQEIVDKQTPRGAWTAKQLAEWGIPWPPPQGWRRELERRWYLVHPVERDKLDVVSYAVDPDRYWMRPWETEQEAIERLATEIDSL